MPLPNKKRQEFPLTFTYYDCYAMNFFVSAARLFFLLDGLNGSLIQCVKKKRQEAEAEKKASAN